MSESLEFLKTLLNDKSLQDVVKKASQKAANNNEMYLAISEIANREGFNISAKELEKEVEEYISLFDEADNEAEDSSIEELEHELEQLDFEDLENVAGGKYCPPPVSDPYGGPHYMYDSDYDPVTGLPKSISEILEDDNSTGVLKGLFKKSSD